MQSAASPPADIPVGASLRAYPSRAVASVAWSSEQIWPALSPVSSTLLITGSVTEGPRDPAVEVAMQPDKAATMTPTTAIRARRTFKTLPDHDPDPRLLRYP